MKTKEWDNVEKEIMKSGISPEGRNYNSCRLFCQRNGIKFPGFKTFKKNQIMIEKNSKEMLSAIERCPPDCECGIAKKPAWNVENAAKMLGVCSQTLRNWVKKAKDGLCSIPFYQKNENSKIFFPIRELIEWDEKKGTSL